MPKVSGQVFCKSSPFAAQSFSHGIEPAVPKVSGQVPPKSSPFEVQSSSHGIEPAVPKVSGQVPSKSPPFAVQSSLHGIEPAVPKVSGQVPLQSLLLAVQGSHDGFQSDVPKVSGQVPFQPSSLAIQSSPTRIECSVPKPLGQHLPRVNTSAGATSSQLSPIREDEGVGLSVEKEEAEAWVPTLERWDETSEEFQDLHLRLSIMTRQLSREVAVAAEQGCVDPAHLRVLHEITAQRDEVGWMLTLSDLELLEGRHAVMQTLSVKQVHMEAQPLMHTRLISNQEVNENLKAWAPAMDAEFQSLLQKGAIEQVSDHRVRTWLDNGEDVEILPGRGVASEKPPEQPHLGPKKKYRAIICGNYQRYSERREAESLYAGGADSLSIRLALRYAGLQTWGASSTDVKTAFLNANLDEAEPKYLICNPPRAMVQAGVVPAGTKWWVRKALYGLTTSPRAWGRHRDKTLRSMSWDHQQQPRSLWQCISDPNVWLILDDKLTPTGILLCYVDDLLVLGDKTERMALLEHVSTVWTCSPFAHSEEGDLCYCGLELRSDEHGLFAGQEKYVRELLVRHEVPREADTPCPWWKEAFDDSLTRDESPCLDQVRGCGCQ